MTCPFFTWAPSLKKIAEIVPSTVRLKVTSMIGSVMPAKDKGSCPRDAGGCHAKQDKDRKRATKKTGFGTDMTGPLSFFQRSGMHLPLIIPPP
jgi:hypothetical protein